MPAAARTKGDAPPRSPERQRLADCIAAYAEAVAHLDRVHQAHQRVGERLFAQLRPAVVRAREALNAARAQEPQRLIDAVLDEETAVRSSLADAQFELAEAEKAESEARQSRTLLDEEIRHSDAEVRAAEHDLSEAVSAVVRSDPARAAVLAEFNRSARRALRCAQALRTAGLVVQGHEAHGLRFVISDAAAPVGVQAFRHDDTWTAAMAALREDADFHLPDLPTPEDPPTETTLIGTPTR